MEDNKTYMQFEIKTPKNALESNLNTLILETNALIEMKDCNVYDEYYTDNFNKCIDNIKLILDAIRY